MGVGHPVDLVERIRGATRLAEVADLLGTDSIHEAYFRAKAVWEEGIRKRQVSEPDPSGLPGGRVLVEDHPFHVHGITHAGTEIERSTLRRYVTQFLEGGASVYCEQGIRSMYFPDFEEVCEMDDYRWAMAKCQELGDHSSVEHVRDTHVDDFFEDVGALASEFREGTFALIESGRSLYGERFAHALGDIAAGFLTDHTDLAVGADYEVFTLTREASEHPDRLIELQRYYERAFLPQPLEREWLRKHDPELEIVSHARNERMAEYAIFHHETAKEVHLIVGAAHQPGVLYYLERPRDMGVFENSFELA